MHKIIDSNVKPFLNENFLLQNKFSEQLYHEYASKQSIIDYHCHLNPVDIEKNRKFENISKIWLAGDHYKWRAMRTAGISESLITGDATDKEKFLAWAKTVPLTLGNPLYHWTHLELQRYFQINTLLNEDTAESIWNECNEKLQSSELSTHGILNKMDVKMVGTTDDPLDSLLSHSVIKQTSSLETQVLPSWRPDKVLKINDSAFLSFIETLGTITQLKINNFEVLLSALDLRLNHFARLGCVTADHGIDHLRYASIPRTHILDTILHKRLSEITLSETEEAQYFTALMVWLARRYQELGWVMQLHIGALRNNNTRLLSLLGPDTGFDSINDRPFAAELSALLNEMDKTDSLPKTILYCLNPRDNEVLATMIGNFQSGGIPGKLQFGSAWWFNDQKDGMERQLQQLSQLGLLSQFVGMLTDSRSFLSYTRHEYFRRILCNLVGTWIHNGEAPNDMKLLGHMIENICYKNANQYFGLASQKV